MMQMLPEALEAYIAAHSTPEDEVLRELSRETHLKVLMPQMLSGHLQGIFLELTSRMLRPARILEIGTYTGYSAICLARGLSPGGVLYTIERNEELAPLCHKYFQKAGLQQSIRLLIGNAAHIIPTLHETFDLVFIDADKINYPLYYDLVFGKVRQGGIIIADNVLWSGKVAEPTHDKDTAALHAFNCKLKNDPRIRHFILPLRDGLHLAVKL
ncbi:MAG: O-methyltransferase [Chitinophagales bacterium]|nr:O-methyltransferase [Chitinophagales bacterium]MDW8420189.1 O-methyltransferase [Chitinophagales bacterium]